MKTFDVVVPLGENGQFASMLATGETKEAALIKVFNALPNGMPVSSFAFREVFLH